MEMLPLYSLSTPAMIRRRELLREPFKPSTPIFAYIGEVQALKTTEVLLKREEINQLAFSFFASSISSLICSISCSSALSVL